MLYSISLVITCKISNNFLSNDTINDCTADSKDQESIKLSITSDGKATKHIRKHHSQESREFNPYPTGNHKAVRNIAKANVKPITQKHCPGMVSKITSIICEPDYLFKRYFLFYIFHINGLYESAHKTMVLIIAYV